MAFIQRQDNVSSGGGGGGGVVTGAAQGVELNGSVVELADAASPAITKTIQLTGSAGNNFVVTSFDDFAALANGDASLISGAGGGAGQVLIQSLGSGDVEILSGSNVISTNANEISFSSVTGVGIFSGTGSPEGVVTASPGSMYLDRTAGWQWVKLSGTGNTGWNRIAETIAVAGEANSTTSGTILSLGASNGFGNNFTVPWDAEVTHLTIALRNASGATGIWGLEALATSAGALGPVTVNVTGNPNPSAVLQLSPAVNVNQGDILSLRISTAGTGTLSVLRGAAIMKRR